jgi:hypothetical protein
VNAHVDSSILELRGVWWLPSAPHDTIVGTLIFDERLQLDAIGYFEEHGDDQSLEARLSRLQQLQPTTYPIIHGLTTDSKKITLCRCVTVGSRSGSGAPETHFAPQVAFIGDHMGRLEELRFTKAAAALAHLPRWTGITGLEYSTDPHPTDANRSSSFTQRLKLKVTNPVQVEDFDLRFGNRGNITIGTYDRAILDQMIVVEFDFALAKGFAQLINWTIRHTENLLSLAVGAPSSILDLYVVTENAKDGRELRVLLPSARRKHARVVEPFRMAFTFADIAQIWPSPLARMFEVRDHVRSALDLYFAVVNSPGLYIEVQFLNLAQALESLHRGRGPSPIMKAEDFDRVRERIEAMLMANDLGLKKDARASLCGKLNHWNEITLRKRLRQILKSLRPAARRALGDNQDFVHRVANTRNYLTHRVPELAYTLDDIPSLIRLTKRMRFVVEQGLMQLIGIPEKLLDRHATSSAKGMAEGQVVSMVDPE